MVWFSIMIPPPANDILLNMRQSSWERRTTFVNWPVDFLNVDNLAAAGFFYLGQSDVVMCPFCGVTVCRWEPQDEPMEEHARHSPRCSFVRDQRNPFSLQNVEQGAHVMEDLISEDEERPFIILLEPRGLDVAGGWEMDEAHTALQTACESLNLTPHTPVKEATSVEVTTNGRGRCCICLDSDADVVLLPCCHVCTCGDCVQRLTECPICKAEIIARTKLYFC